MSKQRDRTVPPGILDPKRRTITNKNTGEVVTWRKYGYETNGELAEAEISCAPGGGPPLHFHTTYNEKFEAVEGITSLYLGDAKEPITLLPGQTAWVPMGTKHRFTNLQKELIRMKGQVIPASAGFERSMYILFGLNEDGMANKEGVPKSIVHTAIISKMSDMKFAGVSGMIMNAMLSAFAWYGEWSGEEERLLQKYWD